MTRHAPALTLLAMVALGGGLLLADVATEPDPEPAPVTAPARAPAADAPRPAGDAAPTETPTPAPFPSPRRYAGSDPTGRYGVAIDVHRRHVVAYLCGGVTTEAWLRGPVPADADQRLRLTAPGGHELVATLHGRRLTGRVVHDGRRIRFTAAPVRKDGPLTAAGQATLGATR